MLWHLLTHVHIDQCRRARSVASPIRLRAPVSAACEGRGSGPASFVRSRSKTENPLRGCSFHLRFLSPPPPAVSVLRAGALAPRASESWERAQAALKRWYG
jgi:hypothetical protein